jgi:hypothetical protein
MQKYRFRRDRAGTADAPSARAAVDQHANKRGRKFRDADLHSLTRTP